MSAYRRTTKLHSPQFLARRKKRIKLLIVCGVLCVGMFLVFLWFLLRASFLQINHIFVEGSSSSEQRIVDTVMTELQGTYFAGIPRTHTFFYPKSHIKVVLLDHFKEIKHLSLKRSGFSGLRVLVEEKKQEAIVCAGFREDELESRCYASDDKGYLFRDIATSTRSHALSQTLSHYYVPTEKNGLMLGSAFVSEEQFRGLQKFIAGALRGGLLPLGILINENGEYEMYINNPNSDSEVTIYFDERASFETTLDNLLLFWDTNLSKSTTTMKFNYINLRFGNTVYYSTQ